MLRRIISSALIGLLTFPALCQTWTLEDCVHYALKNSAEVKKQSYSIEREKLTLQEGKWAFVPKLSISSSYTMSTGRVLDPTTYQFVSTKYTGNSNTSISGDITLFEGGKKIHTLSKAKLSLKAAVIKDESVKRNLQIQIIGAFMDVLCAKEQILIAEETKAINETQLDRTLNLFKAGVVPETEVLQLQTKLSAADKDISSANHTYQMARLTLCDLIGWEDYMHFEVEKAPEPLSDDIEWDLNAVLEGHPEIRSLEVQKNLAELNRKLALSAISPRLSLSAGLGTSYSDARQKTIVTEEGMLKYDAYPFFQQYADNRSAFVSFSLSIPILNGLTTRNGIKRAKIAIKETELNGVETRRKIRKQLIQAKMDCFSAREQYFLSINETHYAEEAFKQVERKYNLGAVDFLTWNTAAVELAKSQYSLAEAKYTYYLKLEILNLYRYF